MEFLEAAGSGMLWVQPAALEPVHPLQVQCLADTDEFVQCYPLPEGRKGVMAAVTILAACPSFGAGCKALRLDCRQANLKVWKWQGRAWSREVQESLDEFIAKLYNNILSIFLIHVLTI